MSATVAGHFTHREARATVRDLVNGLLMELPRANCWTIGEAVGHASPGWLQHLLSRAVWDADAVLAAVARWATTRLLEHASGPVILAVDETGDAKSSTDAVGAAQQYCGALGGIGLCQVAVHLSLVTPLPGGAGRAHRDQATPVPGRGLGQRSRTPHAGGSPRRPDVRDQT